MYQVVYKKRATKMLARMSPVDRRRMLDALGELARDPAAA
jgi:mRNA-degrading endonuclease RelE of RelBE toxin-antitoxin system